MREQQQTFFEWFRNLLRHSRCTCLVFYPSNNLWWWITFHQIHQILFLKAYSFRISEQIMSPDKYICTKKGLLSLNCFEWVADFFAIVNSEYGVLIYCLENKYSERKCLFLKNGAIQQHFADVHIVIFHSCKVQNQNIHEISWTKSTHTIFTYLFTLFNLISRSTCICFNVSTFWLKHPEAYCSNHQ